MTGNRKLKTSIGEKAFTFTNTALLCFLTLITLYPFIYIIFYSFSDSFKIATVSGFMWKPEGFSLEGYEALFSMRNFWITYGNTIFYIIAGCTLNMALTIIGAYALSVKGYLLKKPIMFIIVFTMYFNGGMVPTYLVFRQMRLTDTVWAILFSGCVSVYNLIVLRTSFQSTPQSMLESAAIDGASHFTLLLKIVLPVSKAALATITLFYVVSRWGEWYSSMVYLPQRRDLYPLQMFLKGLVINEEGFGIVSQNFSKTEINYFWLKTIIKYCAAVAATLPILFVYPFLQNYFIKGVLIGSLKE